MTQGWLQILAFLLVLTALVPPIGGYMAKVFQGERVFLSPLFGPIERLAYRILRARPEEGQDWKAYARSIVAFSVLSWLLLYLILRTQSIQPLNPEGFHSGPWNLSFNTASSFVTNTNWQYYGGETTLSYFAQMAGLTVQNFVSAAVGIAALAAVIRGFAARSASSLGNFWADLVRITLYILLPISFVAALVLVSQGVIQTLDGSQTFHTIAGGAQTLALGPVASQEAIKELGTNGGGFFNVNSAMPFENANGFTNVLELILILIVPAGLTHTFGRMIGNRRQGWALYAAMTIMFVAGVAVVYMAEQHGSPAQHHAGVLTHAFDGSTGGNMEGKEQRFGIADSSLWTAVTTVTSCGAVNAAFDSLTGIGGLVPTANLSTGEVIFGGVGSGLYYMLLLALLTVFIAGLMVGRTPEFLGKKIESREVKLVLVGVLVTPLLVLFATAWAVAGPDGTMSIYNHGPQGFSESLYAYMSQANNNGSAFAGYTGFIQPNAPGNSGAYGYDFANLLGGMVMLFARFVPMIAALATAGSLATKKIAPAGAGTFRSDSPTFIVLLIGVVVIVAALTFFPAFLLGPAVQGLTDQPSEMNGLRKDLIAATIAIVFLTLLVGIAYPLLTTGVAQVLFPNASNGSRIEVDGRVVGSKLIGQDFGGESRYFQSRPSATGYSADVTYFNNLGPNSKELSEFFEEQLDSYLKLERPYDPGLTAADVPVDAVTTSASGVDPHISEANARIQAHRVAAVRHLPLQQVLGLVSENTEGRFLALFGEPGVNVLELNLALDEEPAR